MFDRSDWGIKNVRGSLNMFIFCSAGLNSIGILTGGGIGRLLAHWIINGKPGAKFASVMPYIDFLMNTDQDVTAINVDRFHKYQINHEYRLGVLLNLENRTSAVEITIFIKCGKSHGVTWADICLPLPIPLA